MVYEAHNKWLGKRFVLPADLSRWGVTARGAGARQAPNCASAFRMRAGCSARRPTVAADSAPLELQPGKGPSGDRRLGLLHRARRKRTLAAKPMRVTFDYAVRGNSGRWPCCRRAATPAGR